MTPGSANLLLGSSSDSYQIMRSLRLRNSAAAYFNRTPSVAGDRTKWTWSAWVKLGLLDYERVLFSAGPAGARARYALIFNSSNAIGFDLYGAGPSVSTSVYRDPAAWYHIVATTDTTLASARTKIYVNNVLVASIDLLNQNEQGPVSNTVFHTIGRYSDSSGYFDGYITDVNFIDGQALTPSSFGETDSTTGVWKPKRYSGSYGTNGFFLNFADNSALTAAAIGKDLSGAGNNFTPNNISLTAGTTYDSMVDVPTLYDDGTAYGRGNYCVLNPNDKNSSVTISGVNLSTTGATTNTGIKGTMSISSGKWYYEVLVTSNSGFQPMVGFTTANWNNDYIGSNSAGFGWAADGSQWGEANITSVLPTWGTNDILAFAVDMTNKQITAYKNGASVYTYTFSGTDWIPACSHQTTSSLTFNFGQRPFTYTPPSGFKAFNTQNLATPVIPKGSLYFDATTYAGNGGTQTISNLSFQPDLIWIKNRSAVANHAIVDSVRPSGYALYPNLTDAEANNSSLFTGISGNSFSLAGGNSTYNAANNYISWLWKKGATPGFDIVTYTGDGSVARNITHSLGVAPKMIITKMRSSAIASWNIWHTGIGTNQVIYFNSTSAPATPGSGINWNPTSTTFRVDPDSGYGSNASGVTQVAYLFAEVAGFSKFGTYTGNGSSNGPFVFCGFRPRYVMSKRTDTTGNWVLWDTARNTANLTNNVLYSNLSQIEDSPSANRIGDILSNGFKFRGTDIDVNASGGTYIFVAFAENPFKYSLAR